MGHCEYASVSCWAEQRTEKADKVHLEPSGNGILYVTLRIKSGPGLSSSTPSNQPIHPSSITMASCYPHSDRPLQLSFFALCPESTPLPVSKETEGLALQGQKRHGRGRHQGRDCHVSLSQIPCKRITDFFFVEAQLSSNGLTQSVRYFFYRKRK
ncbi:hypothetical protein LX36DRAFT_339329 [Colletotrichum falcatum]|nr:hypothetical protein LX36DRAFT_339329 [Colletotrichum falcatum]